MNLRLFRQFILRRLALEPARTLTTVAGIAVGIAVVIAIQLTNASSVRGFETALDTVSGKASIEITATAGVDETLLPDLGWLREFGAVSPVIEGDMALLLPGEPRDQRPPRTEAVKVLGVDILRDRTVRDYAVQSYMTGDATTTEAEAAAPLSSQSFLELLTSPQSVVITEKLARRRGYRLGSEIQLLAGDRVGTYVVRALLADQGPARVMDGNFVLMDIAAAQLAFDRLGRIDRLDVQIAHQGNALDASQAPTSAELAAAESAIVACRGINRIIEASERGLPALAQKMQIYTPTKAEIAKFRELAQPAVKAQISKSYGKEGEALLADFQAAIDKAAK